MIRAQGYALVEREYMSDVAAIAAPIPTSQGMLALSLAGPAPRFDPARLLNQLMHSAYDLAKALGSPGLAMPDHVDAALPASDSASAITG